MGKYIPAAELEGLLDKFCSSIEIRMAILKLLVQTWWVPPVSASASASDSVHS